MDPKFKHDNAFAEKLGIRLHGSPDILQVMAYKSALETVAYAESNEWRCQYDDAPDTVATQVDMYVSLLEKTVDNIIDNLKGADPKGDPGNKISRETASPLLDQVRLAYFISAIEGEIILEPGERNMAQAYIHERSDVLPEQATADFTKKFGMPEGYEQPLVSILTGCEERPPPPAFPPHF